MDTRVTQHAQRICVCARTHTRTDTHTHAFRSGRLDEYGKGEMIIAKSSFFAGAGLGVFCTRKPRPIEYKRDEEAPNNGWLSQVKN